MNKSLVAFDTDHIKAYVFGTSKLKEIRGASSLLDRLNRDDMVRIINALDNHARCIYANGGAGLFEMNTEHVSEALESVGHLYRQATKGGSTITGASVDMTGATEDQAKALDLLRYRLRANKDQTSGITPVCTLPLLRFCDSCGDESASTTDSDGSFLCTTCAQKRAEDERVKADIRAWATHARPPDNLRLWGRLIEDLERRGHYPIEDHERPEDFENLGELSSPSGYMGLIYADGDSMGQHVDAIQSLDEMQAFSTAVDQAIYTATAEAIERYLQPASDSQTWPFDVLLLGGDDLVIVTRADSAIEVAKHAVQRFPELTEEACGKRLNLSASVVLTHAHYPIGALLDLASSGLTFAKRQAAQRRRQGENLSTGLLNFLVVNSSNHMDFKAYYRQVLKTRTSDGQQVLRTQRPYTAEEMDQLLDDIRAVRDLGVPTTKLEQLRQACFKSRRQGAIDAMMAIMRLRNKDHRQILLRLMGDTDQQQVHMPWIQTPDETWVTPMVDIAELFDFVPERMER